MMEKTCGNCGHGCYESTVYCEVTNDDILVNCEACDEWVEPTSQHRRCDKITQLEQRYQRLAEVARDLWQFVANRRSRIPQSTYILGKTAEQLEELGVEL